MDANRIRRRKLVRLFSSPLVLGPALVGVAGLSASALVGGWLGWAGLAALGLSAVTAACRWQFGAETLQQQAIDDAERQTRKEHLEHLKQLRRQLRRDRDSRTGRYVKRLREAYQRLLDLDPLVQKDRFHILSEVQSRAMQLYQSCLELLQRSLVLWQASRKMATDEPRDKLLQSREQLLEQVQYSMERLETTLDRIQAAAVADHGQQEEHTSLRAELDESLDVARRVQQRIDRLQGELPSHDDMLGQDG